MRRPDVRNELRVWLRDLFVNGLVASPYILKPVRARIYRALGYDFGPGCSVGPGCFLGSHDIVVGRKTHISYQVFFDGRGAIEIGSNVDVAMRVTFVTSTHRLSVAQRRAGAPVAGPIRVGDGSWIGACATVLPGVTIGAGVVVAAGAVVVRDVPDNVLVAGVPARIVRVL